MKKVEIFDTTLRDGEQTPGVSFTVEEKLTLATQIARLNVDAIEAGFPIASKGDFEAVQTIAKQVEGPTIVGLARINFEDIDAAWKAIQPSEKPRLHVFVSTSDIHINSQLKITREEVLELARKGVARATSYGCEVEFSPMDATRSNPEYMASVCLAAIEEGATIINLPDTVGYSTPKEYKGMFSYVMKQINNPDIKLSAHTHNDLGLAVANSLAAVEAGATQVECSVNGIGERAGNCSLEEIVMALRTRVDLLKTSTEIDISEIAKTSRLVSRISGYPLPPNKAIVGRNAFAHESGIHQDGVLKDPETYEIMDPKELGLSVNHIVLGKHSGRHALRQALEQLGYELSEEKLNICFKRFKEIADRKKNITSLDLEALVADETGRLAGRTELSFFQVHVASSGIPEAEVILTKGSGKLYGEATGDGAVEALFAAICKAVGAEVILKDYYVHSISSGEDSLAEVIVEIEYESRIKIGQAVDTDTIKASGDAYLRALDLLL